ncbi:hypothetical protein MHBO_001585 [Bonamia ostreae]|uniref:Uncharacterized protein n=1 Tax=Bonamia ostreae TaxID=126728 RepID=A0ABV2AK25_9EUKA
MALNSNIKQTKTESEIKTPSKNQTKQKSEDLNYFIELSKNPKLSEYDKIALLKLFANFLIRNKNLTLDKTNENFKSAVLSFCRLIENAPEKQAIYHSLKISKFSKHKIPFLEFMFEAIEKSLHSKNPFFFSAEIFCRLLKSSKNDDKLLKINFVPTFQNLFIKFVQNENSSEDKNYFKTFWFCCPII